MAEYIERGTAIAKLTALEVTEPSATMADAKRLLADMSSVDVAPVVRCKDCKHHYDCGVHFCDRLGMDCPDDSDFFCSYGERKDGDDDAKEN